ncbi:MAG: sugar ABC transporter ATP-binding protein [Firmicutes bacterium]|nr:sugar ABC transporter ATP-binding protein [Bacillota bacterium]
MPNIEQEPLLKVEGVSKAFGAVQALINVSFSLWRGEILALVGDNGAGKSTLIKVISGAHAPDSGRVWFNGQEVTIFTPQHARDLGIETIYQDLALANKRSIAENIFLGREFTRNFLGFVKVLDKKRMDEESAPIFERLKVNIGSVRSPVGKLSGGQRQATAIARGIYWDAKLIIMDEPTAALGVRESEKVCQTIEQVKNQGIAVILISHNLEDVFRVADRILVLRRGSVVGERKTTETTRDEVARLMITGGDF